MSWTAFRLNCPSRPTDCCEGDSTRVAGYPPFYPDRYQLYSISHSTPIGSDGLTLTAQASHVETRQRGGSIEGEATLAGLSFTYPLLRSNRATISATASIDGIDSSNYFLDVRFGDYRSRAIRAGASWSRTEGRNGHAASAVVSRGFDIMGARPFAGFSETGFTKLNAQAVAVRGLSRTLSLKLSAKGQYSRDKLPVTERFSLGGRGAGMAFQIGARTAERGAAGSAELTWSLPAKSPPLRNGALFVYADGAVGHVVERPFYRLPAEDVSLASMGGGVRLALGPQWRASAEIAVPVKRPAGDDSRKARFFFGLGIGIGDRTGERGERLARCRTAEKLARSMGDPWGRVHADKVDAANDCAAIPGVHGNAALNRRAGLLTLLDQRRRQCRRWLRYRGHRQSGEDKEHERFLR